MMNYLMSCLKFVYDISMSPNLSLASSVVLHYSCGATAQFSEILKAL